MLKWFAFPEIRLFFKMLAIGLGGFGGSIARYFVSLWINYKHRTHFPWGTLIVNLTGAFLLGFILALLEERMLHRSWYYPLCIGFVGAYTTFSTFVFETLHLASKGNLFYAMNNALLSVLLGVLMVWLGLATAKLLL